MDGSNHQVLQLLGNTGAIQRRYPVLLLRVLFHESHSHCTHSYPGIAINSKLYNISTYSDGRNMYVCNRHLVSSKPAFNLMLHHFKNPPHRLKASLFTIHLQCVVMKISYSNPHPTKFNKSDIFFSVLSKVLPGQACWIAYLHKWISDSTGLYKSSKSCWELLGKTNSNLIFLLKKLTPEMKSLPIFSLTQYWKKQSSIDHKNSHVFCKNYIQMTENDIQLLLTHLREKQKQSVVKFTIIIKHYYRSENTENRLSLLVLS